MASYSFRRLPEVFATSAEHKSLVTNGLRTGQIRRIRRGIYTTNLKDPLETVVKRNLWPIVAILAPGAVVSHRTALEGRPSPGGLVVVTGSYSRTIKVPGLVVRQLRGEGPLEGDAAFIDGLHMSSRPRFFMECLSGKAYGGDSPFLSSAEVEAHLEKLLLLGEGKLNEVRDVAKKLSSKLGMQSEFARLDAIVGALLGTGSAKLTSKTAIARPAGEPYDPNRMEVFQILFDELSAWPDALRPDPITSGAAFQNLGFFDAYFSNIIEGTEFGVDEAIDIAFHNKIPSARPEDAHDILGTFRIVANAGEMAVQVAALTASDFLDLLRSWHLTIMQGRPDKRPGEFKEAGNRAGHSVFVDSTLVRGTLRGGFELARGVRSAFGRAVFLMFVVAEVHPFDDGNGRLARAVCSAELVSHQERRLIVPTVFRVEYLDALRLLSRERQPRTLVRMADQAQEFTADIDFSDLTAARARLGAWNAFEAGVDSRLRRPISGAQAALSGPVITLPPSEVSEVQGQKYPRLTCEIWPCAAWVGIIPVGILLRSALGGRSERKLPSAELSGKTVGPKRPDQVKRAIVKTSSALSSFAAKNCIARLALPILIASASLSTAAMAQSSAQGGSATRTSATLLRQSPGHFSIVPDGAILAKVGYFPVPINVTSVKPAWITKEPKYSAAPKYAVLHLGNGPRNTYAIALDEPANGDWKIYIDKNQDGNLTEDGDGAWNKKTAQQGRTLYGPMDVTLRASYGTATRETSSAPYTIGLYRFSSISPLLMYRESAREGMLTVDGKEHKAILMENDADAIYDKHVETAKQAMASRPEWLEVDLADDGTYSSGLIDIRGPFKLAGSTYEADISANGSNVALVPTTKAALVVQTAAAPPPLLKKGTVAPNFVADRFGGGQVHLSDFRGKTVVLDFWATWCGPCQASMPHMEQIYQAVKNQNVVVLGVCVWDTEDAFAKWVPAHQSQYQWLFAFDPAGKTANNIAQKLYNVSGIPTTYIIDKNGKVANALVGYEDGDTEVDAALQKLGINIAVSKKQK